MAFTEDQKTALRMYLGYPDIYRYKNTRLESVLDNLSPSAETVVVGILSTLATIDEKVLNSGLKTAGLKRAEDIEWYEGKTVADMRNIGRERVGRLSILLGVPTFGDVFGKGGYPGDSFFGSGGGSSNGGMMPMG